MKDSSFRGIMFLSILFSASLPVMGHGVELMCVSEPSITVYAAYDSGEPLSGAVVTVFHKGVDEPFMTGICDEMGRYIFSSLPGTALDIQVMKDGHGGWLHISAEGIDGDHGSITSGAPGTPEKIIMTVCVVWGLIGTALYFRSGTRASDASA